MPRSSEKDKLFQRSSEVRASQAGIKVGQSEAEAGTGTLDLNRCALSMTVIATPVMTPSGVLYDSASIIPWISKHQTCPITGMKLVKSDLLYLHIDRDTTDGTTFICGISGRRLTCQQQVVVIRSSARMYDARALRDVQAHAKATHGCYPDPVSSEPYDPSTDVVVVCDPADKALCARRATRPHTVRSDSEAAKLKAPSAMPQRTAPSQAYQKQAATSTAGLAGGPTAVTPPSAADGLAWQAVRAAGSHAKATIVLGGGVVGELPVLLYACMAPGTCDNWLRLARAGAYNGCPFHRLIAGFMAQTGDTTSGDGTGGASAWGKPFEDEVVPALTHDKRGVLAMANAGPNTNRSQFYITFGAASHLDGKHTVFGKLTGGKTVLDQLERVPTSARDSPLQPVRIERVIIEDDPFDAHRQRAGAARAGHKRARAAGQATPSAPAKPTAPASASAAAALAASKVRAMLAAASAPGTARPALQGARQIKPADDWSGF